MDYKLREKVAAFIEQSGILKEARMGQLAARVGQAAMKARGPMAGAAAGAGGVLGLSALGQRDQETQQAAAEMRQLLEAYPELMNEMPGVGAPMAPDQAAMMGGGGGQMDPYGGQMEELPPELLYMLQQQQQQQAPPMPQQGGGYGGGYGPY